VVFGTSEISGDLAGAACRHIEDTLRDEYGTAAGAGAGRGTDPIVLWTPGPLGDQAPRIDLGVPFGTAPDERQKARAYTAMDAQGLVVGAEVVRVAREIRDVTGHVSVEARQRTVLCPVKAGRDIMETMRQSSADTVPLRLSLVRLGDVALAGVSGEVVTEVYEHLRRRSPLTRTVLVSIANDRIGYLPDDARYDRPVHSVNGCPVRRGHAESAIVDGLLDLIAGRTASVRTEETR
jgi:hypothetical protein